DFLVWINLLHIYKHCEDQGLQTTSKLLILEDFVPILYSFKFKNIFYTGQACCLTQVILKTLDKGALQAYLCIVVFS
ncbi:hypothetical protein, partial [Veillonella sp.]|uniref:hypothetical protein n=1 Tax=Veillonella sp. TaxID=1926307 RepID=UPI0025F5A9F9